MAINDETLRLARARRQELVDINDATILALANAWASLWDDLAPEYESVLLDLAAANPDGMSGTQMARAERLQQALDITHDRLAELADYADQRIAGDVQRIVSTQPPASVQQLRSQLPAGVTISFGDVSEDALAAIIARSTQQIHSRTRPLSRDMEQAMKRQLTQGIAEGLNPRETARRILQDVEGEFAGGLGRAMTIARSEQLDSMRLADQLSHQANADVIAANVWMCELSAETCLSCLAQHGKEFPVDAFGPEDHPNGRCAFVTRLKSWAELGLGEGVPEPPDVISAGDGRAFFDSLTADTQRQMMGPAKFEAFQRGEFAWDDLTVRRENPDWRAYYTERPLKELVG